MSQGIQRKSLFKIVVIVLVLFFLVILVRIKLLPIINNSGNNTNPKPVVCTMEAKLCPDGSYVGRGGPNCDFALCPANTIESVATTTPNTVKIGSNLSFTYSDTEIIAEKYELPIWGGEFATKVQLLNQPFSCKEGERLVAVDGGQRETEFAQKIISGRNYCVAVNWEGAAGTTFYNYAYTFVKDSKTFVLTFTLAYGNCGALGEPEDLAVIECEKWYQLSKSNVDTFADQIARSVRLK